MKILLFKKTTDADLFLGLEICYKDINGAYTKLGTITDTIIQDSGNTLYLLNTSMGAYTADELKLIEVEPAKTYREMEAAVIIHQSFVPVTEDLYYEALEVLPPIWLKNGCFQVDECVTRDLYHTFGKRGDNYYGCLCNSNFALNNF